MLSVYYVNGGEAFLIQSYAGRKARIRAALFAASLCTK